jgi:hypothetical protein
MTFSMRGRSAGRLPMVRFGAGLVRRPITLPLCRPCFFLCLDLGQRDGQIFKGQLALVFGQLF